MKYIYMIAQRFYKFWIKHRKKYILSNQIIYSSKFRNVRGYIYKSPFCI